MFELLPPKDDGLFTPTVGKQSSDKHYFLMRYIDIFTTAMKGKWKGLHYIDLFAGAGIEKLRGSEELHWGSPMIAAKAPKPFDRLHLCELNLQKYQTHPTVDMIYTDLYKKVPTLSKTTIYNTMDIFRAKGLVKALPFLESEFRFEYQDRPHHHLVCKQCNQIYDIYTNCDYQKAMTIEGHRIEEIHGSFRGVCKKCQK